MNYINARDVLPPELIEAVQQHVEGQLIYIPCRGGKRCLWGSKSGSRSRLGERNRYIRQAYHRGDSLASLAASQHLSEECIRKIIYGETGYAGAREETGRPLSPPEPKYQP